MATDVNKKQVTTLRTELRETKIQTTAQVPNVRFEAPTPPPTKKLMATEPPISPSTPTAKK